MAPHVTEATLTNTEIYTTPRDVTPFFFFPHAAMRWPIELNVRWVAPDLSQSDGPPEHALERLLLQYVRSNGWRIGAIASDYSVTRSEWTSPHM